MNNITIKPCPRCGNKPQILKSIDWDSLIVDYYPQCTSCKLTTLRVFETEELAISAWNDLELKNAKMFCRDCTHFIGAGDWNLCCTEHHEGYPFGFLCYEDTPACEKFDKKRE